MSNIVDINAAAVRADGPDYSKFDFQKGNNTARILIPNTNIAQAFVHSIYRSEAIMAADEKGRLKAEWESSTYAGSFLCTGDFGTVAKSPSYGDPENCPACAALHNGPRVTSAPKKQFALNVLRYQTKPNSYDVLGDSVTVELWKHGNDRNIQPIQTALRETEKPIVHLDFLIETDGSVFKKLQIQFMFPATYGKEGKDALKASVQNAMQNLYSEDTLVAALGEKVSQEEMANNVRAAVAQATAGQTAPEPTNMFAAEPTPQAATPAFSNPVEQTPAEDLVKVDVASIDALL